MWKKFCGVVLRMLLFSNIRHEDFRLFVLCPSSVTLRVPPPWNLKWAWLESSGQIVSSLYGKIKRIAFFWLNFFLIKKVIFEVFWGFPIFYFFYFFFLLFLRYFLMCWVIFMGFWFFFGCIFWFFSFSLIFHGFFWIFKNFFLIF